MENITKKITVEIESPLRTDAIVKKYYPHLSNKEIDIICENGCVKQKEISLKKGDKVSGSIDIFLTYEEENGVLFKNQNIKPNIVYEDENILLVDKDEGMPTVANTFLDKNTLVNVILNYTSMANEGGVLNGGSINRLDNDTSGIVIFAKNNETYEKLYYMYHSQKNKCEKYYMALIEDKDRKFPHYLILKDKIEKSGNGKMKISNIGKEATIEISIVMYFKNYSILLIKLHEGIRHQIRLQLANADFPILGDKLYNGSIHKRLMLHSYMIKMIHPYQNKYIEVRALFDFIKYL